MHIIKWKIVVCRSDILQAILDSENLVKLGRESRGVGGMRKERQNGRTCRILNAVKYISWYLSG